MALTQLEADILLLSDAGRSPLAISRSLPASYTYVSKTVSRYSVNLKGQRKAEETLRQQTRKLGRAIVAMGGHQAMPEMKGIYR